LRAPGSQNPADTFTAMGDQYILEHRERRLTRRVRHNRFRIALAIAAILLDRR
jgi:hypothetical protein